TPASLPARSGCIRALSQALRSTWRSSRPEPLCRRCAPCVKGSAFSCSVKGAPGMPAERRRGRYGGHELHLESVGIQPPYSMQAEQSVLGAALLKPEEIGRAHV